MSAGDDHPLPAPGPIEAEVLAELARADGGLADATHADAGAGAEEGEEAGEGEGAGTIRTLQGGRAARGAETVVLLHGRGHAAPIWFPCWPALAARHRLLAVDLPGFGGSTMPASHARPRDAEDALRVFADPVDRLLARLLATEAAAGRAIGFSLVGHSLGGLVALELALRARLPIRRLVLIDGMGLGPAMTWGGRSFFRLHPERLARALGVRLFERLNPPPATALGRRVAALEYELLTARSPARAAAARAFDRLCPAWPLLPLAVPAFHRRDRLPAIAAPVLLIWGQRDAALPMANGVAARDALSSSPSATLLTFLAGHSPHLEVPQAVLPPLLDFLAGGLPAQH